LLPIRVIFKNWQERKFSIKWFKKSRVEKADYFDKITTFRNQFVGIFKSQQEIFIIALAKILFFGETQKVKLITRFENQTAKLIINAAFDVNDQRLSSIHSRAV
jgi:hypothetical protein